MSETDEGASPNQGNLQEQIAMQASVAEKHDASLT